jgi:hypothetical protein
MHVSCTRCASTCYAVLCSYTYTSKMHKKQVSEVSCSETGRRLGGEKGRVVRGKETLLPTNRCSHTHNHSQCISPAINGGQLILSPHRRTNRFTAESNSRTPLSMDAAPCNEVNRDTTKNGYCMQFTTEIRTLH